MLSSMLVMSQLKFIGTVSDTCDSYSSRFTYTSESLGNPSAGWKWKLYKDNKLIASGGGGDLGCCAIQEVKALSDDIIFIVISNRGSYTRFRSIDGGKTFKQFNVVGGSLDRGLHFFSPHTGYSVSGSDWNTELEYKNAVIRRISDINPGAIYEGPLDTLVKDVYVADTLFDSNCPEIKELVYRFNKDGVDINLHVVFFQGETSIKNIHSENSILLYPNPIKDFLSIKLEKESLVHIIDQYGRICVTGSFKTGQNDIDLSKLKQGFYIVHIQSKNSRFSKLIVKK